ncbi:uncharacterized protein LOC126901447 [Daktulosphaira vitifoliae]|uniref:uncharacterized protein LOC126901447 n=1 Tax=Daktulosphaira vitifoliae TaxID=58002 RepID=UPI0021AAE36A|nr:uncharacterized protein LOC126901447 [Daktulosphaira vitifoliae]
MNAQQFVLLLIIFWSYEVHSNQLTSILDKSEKCAQIVDLWPCLKEVGVKVVQTILNHQGEIPLLGSYLSIIPNKEQLSSNQGTNIFNISTDSFKLVNFMKKKQLRLILPMNTISWLIGEQINEGRGKKGSGILMLGGMMMMTTLMATAFGVLALMAGKGLLTSVVALMFSAIAISKKSGHGHARTTYEIIDAPQDVGQKYMHSIGPIVSDANHQPSTEPILYGNQQYE